MAYDGLQMLQQHLSKKADIPEEEEKIINPKLKQFYEKATRIEPFYTGGKIVVLPGSRFGCKCGAAVKLVSTTETSLVKLEDDGVDMEETEPDHGSFGVIGTYECEMDEIVSFDACPSTNTLITSHKSQLLRVWNLHSGEVTRTIKSFHSTPISHTEIHKTESATMKQEINAPLQEDSSIQWGEVEALTWATVAGNSVKVWKASGNQVSKQIRIEGVPSLGFVKWETTADVRHRFFVAERNIYCIEKEAGSNQYSLTQTLTGHFSQVTGLEWATGNVMVSAGRDKAIIIWSTAQPQIEKLKSLAFPGVIESVTLLRLKDLYVASTTGVIKHMNIESFSITPEDAQVLKDGEETLLTLYPPMHQGLETEARSFFASTHLCTLYQLARSKSKKKASRSTLSISTQFVGSLDEILDIALWGNTHVAVANNTPVITVYDLGTGSCQFLRGHADIVLSVASKKEHLVSASKDNRIIVWKFETNEPLKILEGHLASVTAVCFSTTKLEIYSVSEDHFLKRWSVEKCLKSVVAHENEIHSVHCSPNGLLIVTASRDKTSKIWDSETLKLRGTLKGHKKSVWDAKFSAWDQLVISSSADSTLKIWNLTSFECIKTLQGHQSSVLRGHFINSGLQAISAGSDGTLRAWDLRTSQCLAVFENSEDKVWGLDSTPDGNFVVTGSADALLTIWKDVTDRKVKEAVNRRKNLLETEQKLQNVIESGKWAAAVQLAIQLKRPFALLRVIRTIPPEEKDALQKIVGDLSMSEKKTVIEFIEKWNTNSRTSTEAQTLLNLILKTTPPKNLSSIKMSTLLPYTEKHYKRLLKVQLDCCMIKFLSQDKRVEPDDSLQNSSSQSHATRNASAKIEEIELVGE